MEKKWFDEYEDCLHPAISWAFWILVFAACVVLRKIFILLGAS